MSKTYRILLMLMEDDIGIDTDSVPIPADTTRDDAQAIFDEAWYTLKNMMGPYFKKEVTPE